VTTRVTIGVEDDEAVVLRDLFGILGEDADQRQVVWVPGERAVDVPDDVAEKYLEAKTAKPAKAAKAAKAAPPPAPDTKE